MKDLREKVRAEDAVETIGGLAAMISYVNDVASDADLKQLRDPVGFTLNAIGHEVHRARKSFDRTRRSRWRGRRNGRRT
jgi:uncharacterized protein with von Willebrand factor type A (vWA) domain